MGRPDTASFGQDIVQDVEKYCLKVSPNETTPLSVTSSDLKLMVVRPPVEYSSDNGSSDEQLLFKTRIGSDDGFIVGYTDKVRIIQSITL